MKFIPISDMHLEFHKLDYVPLNVEDAKQKVLVLAGDINVGIDSLIHTLVCYAEDFKHVIFVAGNHDYYGCNGLKELDDILANLDSQVENLHVLNKRIVNIDGVNIGGATMWGLPTVGLNDLREIKNFKSEDMRETHEDHVRWLTENADKVDLMVTHFCPSPDLGNPNYPKDRLTNYFSPAVAKDMTRLPPVWVFGHTHYARDEFYRATHFISVPVGYPGELKLLEIKEYDIEPSRTTNNAT